MALASGPAFAAAGAAAQTSKPADPTLQTRSLAGAYLAAKSAQLGGDTQEATAFFSQALTLDPTSQVLQQDAMFAFLADGRFKEGAELAAKLRDDSEAGKVARMTLGVDALARGDHSAAIAQLDIPNPSDLDRLLVSHLMSWADLGDKRPDEALSRIDELDGVAWYPIFNQYQKGLLAEVAGRPEVAKTAYAAVVADRQGAQTSPDAYLAAIEGLARIEARADDKTAALKTLATGLELAPRYDPLLALKADIEAGRPVEPTLTSVKEGAAETLYILGQAINRGDGQQVALLYFQLARALDPASPALLTALAGIAERGERLDVAIAYYAQIPETSPYHRTAELQTGLDLWYAERKDEAKAHLNKAVADYPDDIQAHTALADVLAADKDYKGASVALDRAIALSEPVDPTDWNLYYQRGIAFERQKMWPKAEADLKKALELSPDQPSVLNYLGYSWVDMGMNLDEGLNMIRKAVDLRPNDGYIIDSLGWAYYRLARFDDAVSELERAVLINPVDPTINDHLGDAYWQVGRKREARFQWNRALVGDPKPEAEAIMKIQAKLKDGLTPDAAGEAKAAPAPADKRADGGAAAPAETVPAKPASTLQ
ncbi:hypothetical protein ASG48_00830 [Aurantimonas sp. Leaf443]|nr:hypothetical protein ASG48_00830 [Aurantimonas sp. Leaf443]